MKFIDKALRQAEGNLLINEFISSQWNDITQRYSSIGYESPSFRRNIKSRLKLLLLAEQGSLCCYCMRQLENDSSATLEHIVPKATRTQAQLDLYSHHQLIRDNVCLQSVFERATTRLNTPPFPLEVAFENLVASCRGDFPGGATYHICNHKRGNDFIEPFFYIATIDVDISYTRAGLLYASSSVYDESIITLNLNYDSLEHIRQVWYHISVESLDDIENALTEADRNVVLTLNLISLPPVRRNKLIADFKTETFWNVLLQYKWFHGYYRARYPIATRE